MNMRPRLAERLRPRRGWLIPAALLVLAPKCALCLLAYAGLGAALGIGGPELCGASGDATRPGTIWLAVLGGALGAAALLVPAAKRRSRPEPFQPSQPRSE